MSKKPKSDTPDKTRAPESPGFICSTPPQPKITGLETSPSLLQHQRPHRRRRKLQMTEKSPIAEEPENSTLTPIKEKFIEPVSPIVYINRKQKTPEGPVPPKATESPPVFIKKLNRNLFLTQPDEATIEVSQFHVEKRIFQPIPASQFIDEFDNALENTSERPQSKAWKPQEKISEILSAERTRRSLCREQMETETRRKIPKGETLDNYLKIIARCEAEQNLFEYTSDDPLTGWKDFYAIEVFDCVPIIVRASGEEGIVTILLTDDVIKNQNALEPGSILRIYPPWAILNGSDDEPTGTIYTFVNACDVRCVEGRRVAEKVELTEIPIEPFLTDPGKIIRSFFGDDC